MNIYQHINHVPQSLQTRSLALCYAAASLILTSETFFTALEHNG